MKNNFGDIGMEQDFGNKKNKVVKIGDIIKWPKNFGDCKNVTKTFGDIANRAKRKMALGQVTDDNDCDKVSW